jgi:hypothetical protein
VTLALSLANPRFTIQMSDRRLTAISGSGDVLTEEANKAGALVCGDAHLAYSFTGLAFSGSATQRTFDTRRWLLGAILEAAKPEFQIEFIAERFCKIATQEFRLNQDILHLPKRNRKLSLMLTGYWDTNAGCLPAGWIITNFQQNFDIGTGAPDLVDPWDEFRCWRWHQTVPPTGRFVHIERLGVWRGVTNFEMAWLENLMRDDRPVDAIIGSALKVMYRASDADVTSGTVGKQINIVVVPQKGSEKIRFAYESNVVTKDVFVPDMLIATGPEMCKWMTLHIEGRATSASSCPVSVPRVHRKRPCPCGSGQMYERCHRRFRRDISRYLQEDGERALYLTLDHGGKGLGSH